MAPPTASASDKRGRDAVATTSSLRAPDRPGAPRGRRLGTAAPTGTHSTEGAHCAAPHMRVGCFEIPIKCVQHDYRVGWPAGCGNEREMMHLRSGALPQNRGSAEVAVPGRRPFRPPRVVTGEPAAGCCGMQRPCASPGPRFVRGRSAPLPATRPQVCCPPRRGALTTH